ncbi:MAG: DHH family phosphoesterase, partial [Clostridia bacterium]|nr:DHH family phosphoesterase [Clostridia bacterium]
AENSGNIIWFNTAFDAVAADFPEARCAGIAEYIGSRFDFADESGAAFEVAGASRFYTVYPSRVDENAVVFYFVDDTALKLIRAEFSVTRPVVLLINIDSLEQTEDNLAHADFYSLISDVDRLITGWLVSHNCVFRKYSDGKFIAVTECRNLDEMMAKNFNLLDTVRGYRHESGEVDITLSVGVGKEENFAMCEASARQALDMARGRGGDQVAVKVGDSYEFFGGITNRKEKRGKVKSRIVAAALNDYIENASAVFIMGHAYSDFDCLGAAVGVAAIARACGKPAYVIVNRKTTLAMPLVKMIEDAGAPVSFLAPEKAADIVTDNALLVITDTMRKNLVEAPALLSRELRTVIIDHHRMTVDHIENAALLFHEPYASSACEMVTELVQYAPSKPKLKQAEAQALLSGILLDTKDFSLRVGVRTFEAAAFLRDRKTDTVAVKKLFAGSIEENVSVSKIMAAATFYKNYCIAVAPEEVPDMRLICSKAADELLNIENVDASFVVYENSGSVSISARSFGKINVQLIMEALGGGGHQSMAACQLADVSTGEAAEKLREAINA